MTGTPLIDLKHNKKKPQEATADGLAGYIDHREKEKAKAKANHSTAAMQTEIDRRMMAAQQRQMMEMQQMGQAQAQQMSPQITPQMHIPGGYPTPTPQGLPQGYPPAFAFSSQEQLQMYQQPGYFPQQGVSVSPMMAQGMQPGWGTTPSPQPMQGPYFAQQSQPQAQMQPQPQQRYTQPYGASFDQAQAAARFAHQNR
jgi:CCR4-NOT transcriptional complex subunit CAF120